MKVTFIFTDSADLTQLETWHFHKTSFEFPDEATELPDLETQLLSVAESVGALTDSTLHVTCKNIGWNSRFISMGKEVAPQKISPLRFNFLVCAFVFRQPGEIAGRSAQRTLRVLNPVSVHLDFLQNTYWKTGRRKKRRTLPNAAQIVAHYAKRSEYAEILRPYLELQEKCLGLLNASNSVDNASWQSEGFHPLWKDKSLITKNNNLAKKRDKEIAKRERERVKQERAAAKSQKQVTRKGQVYFIQQGTTGPIKIGYSTNPEKRLATLNTASPYTLRLLVTMIGGKKLETELHQKIADHRLEGEWFEPHSELLVYINEIQKREE